MQTKDIDLEEYKEWLYELEISKQTIKSYQHSARLFFERYDEINKSNLIQFKRQMLDMHKPATAQSICCGMNKMCEYIGKPEYKLKTIRKARRTRLDNIPTMREYKRILRCLKKDENWKTYYMIKFLAKTGVRVSELIKLDKSHLEQGEAEMWTKGKIRRILIPQDLIDESRWYFDQTKGWALFTNYKGERIGVSGVRRRIYELEKYGIRREILYPHAFRHFFAIHFLEQTGDIVLLADLLGHSGLGTTQIYLTLSAQEQRDRLNEAMEGW